jgi:AcrR family transcriptional regulator
MAPDERRRAIVTAITPLLVKKGALATTADMAKAAGIAEGTIFRVFPDKSALLYEVIRAATDPAELCVALRSIDPDLPMRAQLAQAAQLLSDHWKRVAALGEALRGTAVLPGSRQAQAGRVIKESSAAIAAALTTLFERHRRELRIPPAKAVAAFRGLVLAAGHPLMPEDQRLGLDDVTTVLLSGVGRSTKGA